MTELKELLIAAVTFVILLGLQKIAYALIFKWGEWDDTN